MRSERNIFTDFDTHPGAFLVKLDALATVFLYAAEDSLMFKFLVSCFRMPGPEKLPNLSPTHPILCIRYSEPQHRYRIISARCNSL